jgi:hypothetical protein
MQHLGVLESSGLALVRREGRYRYTDLKPVTVWRNYERWIRPFSERVAGEVLALEQYILSSEESTMEYIVIGRSRSKPRRGSTPRRRWSSPPSQQGRTPGGHIARSMMR